MSNRVVYRYDNWTCIGEAARNVVFSHPAFSRYRICLTCAEAAGGRWPMGHRPPAEEADCLCCGRRGPLTEVADWSWV
jgi:hypothetical protein